MTRIWSNGEADYKANIKRYNAFLEKFGTGIVREYNRAETKYYQKRINVQLSNQEVERVIQMKDALNKLLASEPGFTGPNKEVESAKQVNFCCEYKVN